MDAVQPKPNISPEDRQFIAALRKLLEYKTTAYSCECPDYFYRRKPKLTICKHIRAFRALEPYLEEVKIMPIKGLTHDRQRMLPRVGKLKLGVKQKHSNGNEYPVKTEHFVLPQDLPDDIRASFMSVYGETPKEITIILPTMDLDIIAPTWYKAYQQTRDWVCKGDGERAMRKMNPERVSEMGRGVWGPLPQRDDRNIQLYEVICRGRDCPDYKRDDNPRGACGEVMNVQFLMPDVEGYGVWQIDTGSFHSITGFYDSVAYLNLFGNFAGVPLTLALEPKDVTPFGKKITVYVLKLRKPGKLENMLEAAKSPMWKALGPGVVPAPDEEADDLLHAEAYAPEGVVPLPDDDDHSNAANLRRAQAGVPPHDPETGEVFDPPPAEKPRTIAEKIEAIRARVESEGILTWEAFETDVLHIGNGKERADYSVEEVWQAYVRFKDETQLDTDGAPMAPDGIVDEWVDDTDPRAAAAEVVGDDYKAEADQPPPADDASLVCSECTGPLHPMDADGICSQCRRKQDQAEAEAGAIDPEPVPAGQEALLPE